MTVYSYAQLEQLWIQNGGPASVAPTAAAIALAESSGNSAAENTGDNGGKQTSWGLWQISNGTHAQPVANILDPNVNAAQAVAKYRGAGNTFTPWGTYDSGAYLGQVSNSVPASSAGVPAATATASTVSVGAPVPGCMIGPPSFSVAGFTIGGGCWFTKSEARALIGGMVMVFAGGLVLPGLIILVAAGFRGSGAAGALSGAAAPLTAVPGYGKGVRAASRPRQPRRGASPAAAASSPARPASSQSRPQQRPVVGRQPGESFRYATPRES